MKKLFRFVDQSMDSDKVNDNGKVTRHKTVNVIAESEFDAITQAKLDASYSLSHTFTLSKIYDV